MKQEAGSCSKLGPVRFGPVCVSDGNQCQSHMCVHGDCVDQHQDYKCLCYHGYEGRYCQYSESDLQPAGQKYEPDEGSGGWYQFRPGFNVEMIIYNHVITKREKHHKLTPNIYLRCLTLLNSQ